MYLPLFYRMFIESNNKYFIHMINNQGEKNGLNEGQGNHDSSKQDKMFQNFTKIRDRSNNID